MQSCIFSSITPVFSVTWSSRYHNNMLICKYLRCYNCSPFIFSSFASGLNTFKVKGSLSVSQSIWTQSRTVSDEVQHVTLLTAWDMSTTHDSLRYTWALDAFVTPTPFFMLTIIHSLVIKIPKWNACKWFDLILPCYLYLYHGFTIPGLSCKLSSTALTVL